MSVGTIVATILLIGIVYFFPPFLMYPALFLFGFSISAFLLCYTMIKEIHSIQAAGTSIGVMNALTALFVAFSDPLTGKFLDLGWTGELLDGARIFSVFTYRYAFLVLIFSLLVSLVLLKFVRETFCKQR